MNIPVGLVGENTGGDPGQTICVCAAHPGNGFLLVGIGLSGPVGIPGPILVALYVLAEYVSFRFRAITLQLSLIDAAGSTVNPAVFIQAPVVGSDGLAV